MKTVTLYGIVYLRPGEGWELAQVSFPSPEAAARELRRWQEVFGQNARIATITITEEGD